MAKKKATKKKVTKKTATKKKVTKKTAKKKWFELYLAFENPRG